MEGGGGKSVDATTYMPAAGPARDPGAPLAQLLAELPLEQTDLVPLGALVERVSNSVYQTLQNLGDTLVALPSDEKRRRIFATALALRRTVLKLLVIVRWARDADQLGLARNVVALLADQQWAHEDVFAGLTQVRSILPNARLRDADLATAIDVMRTHTYTRLPASLADSALPRPPLADADVRAALHALTAALRVRLATADAVPPGMRLDCVRDGKVYLAAPGLYRLTLTAASGRTTDRWWLLAFEFEHAAHAGQEQLTHLDRAYLEAVHAAAEAALEAGDAAESPSSSPPLLRLHTSLTEQALQRQLDILYAQAQHMAVNWGANVAATLDAASRTLTVRYWTRSGHARLFHGALELSVCTSALRGAARVLAGVAGSTHAQARIALHWDIDATLATEPPPPLVLDMEALVLAAIERHVLALLRAMRARIAPTGITAELHAQTAGRFGARHVLHLRHPALHVLLYVSTLGGRIALRPLDDARGALALDAARTHELQRAADTLGGDIDALPAALTQLCVRAHSRQLAARAAWLGLASSTQLTVRPGELARLADGHPLLFLPLPPGAHVLMLHQTPSGAINPALLALVPVGVDGVAVGSCRWLDRAAICAFRAEDGQLRRAPAPADPADVSTHELLLLHTYCAATVAYLHIEEQLRLALVAFELVGATTERASPPGYDDPLLPSLCVRGDELLGGSVGSRNVSLRVCDWWRPADARVEVAFRLALPGAPSDVPPTRIDDATIALAHGVFTYSSPKIADAVPAFLRHWRAIAVLCALHEAVPKGTLAAAVTHYDLLSLSFAYGDYGATVALRTDGGPFTLTLTGERNPHSLIAPLLEAELNAARDPPPRLWAGFLHLLDASLPVLAALQSASERALVDTKVPDVAARSVTWYRVQFAQHALDVRLMRHARILVSDAAMDAGDVPSPFTALPPLASVWPPRVAGADALDEHTLLLCGDAAQHVPTLIGRLAKKHLTT